MTHGTLSKYNNHRCRCDWCRLAWADYCAEARWRRTERLKENPDLVEHGSQYTYSNWGCRCRACTDAMSAACYARKLRRKERIVA